MRELQDQRRRGSHADYMLRYTPLRQASLRNAPTHPNTIPACRIGQLSAGPKNPQQHLEVVSQLSAAATRRIQLSTKARQSYRRPRGAQLAIRKEAPLTTP